MSKNALKNLVLGLVAAAILAAMSAMAATSRLNVHPDELDHVNAGRYKEACDAYLLYKRVAGRDCSIRANGCYGVWTRAQDRQRRCLEAQP